MAKTLRTHLVRAALLLFAALVVGGLIWSSLPANLQTAKDWASASAPFIALLSLATAVSVAYVSWLTPFAPYILSRPYVWRMAPSSQESKSLNIVFWLTISNSGARPGSVDDFVVEVAFPKGTCLLQPLAFVKSEEYFLSCFGKQLDSPPFEGPFAPLYLAGRSQVTRAVLFSPISESAFDPAHVESGVHKIRLYSRVNGKRFEISSEQKLVFEDDVLHAWKQGGVVGGMVNHRDTDVVNLLPRAT